LQHSPIWPWTNKLRTIPANGSGTTRATHPIFACESAFLGLPGTLQSVAERFTLGGQMFSGCSAIGERLWVLASDVIDKHSLPKSVIDVLPTIDLLHLHIEGLANGRSGLPGGLARRGVMSGY